MTYFEIVQISPSPFVRLAKKYLHDIPINNKAMFSAYSYSLMNHCAENGVCEWKMD